MGKKTLIQAQDHSEAKKITDSHRMYFKLNVCKEQEDECNKQSVHVMTQLQLANAYLKKICIIKHDPFNYTK